MYMNHSSHCLFSVRGFSSLCLLAAFGLAPVLSVVAQQPKKAATPENAAAPKRKVAAAKAPAKKPPVTPEQLRAVIQEKLTKNPYYTPGALLSRHDVEPIFNYLLERGVTIAADQEELYDSILPDNAHLVRLLKTPNGRTFMKNIANDPTAYDRLERLSWNPDGRRLIEGFINSKDGVTKFQNLKTGDQIGKLSKSLAADSRITDYLLPTGHIHTADALTKSLTDVLNSQQPAE